MRLRRGRAGSLLIGEVGGRIRQVSDTEDEGLILGDRKCIKSMNLAGVGLTLHPFTRENYRYQLSSSPTRTVLDGQNEGERGEENQNGPPGSQVDQIGTRDGQVGPPQLSTNGSTGHARWLLLPRSAVPPV